MIELEFFFHSRQRELFRSGVLIDIWASRYPQLFDDKDIVIARKQNAYHFFEWLAAVLLYESTGYLSLVEKYELNAHTRKVETLKKAVPSSVYDFVKNRKGIPDLFVYAPNFSDWFFCEVKGLGDVPSPEQIKCIQQLEELSGKQVRVIRFTEIGSQ